MPEALAGGASSTDPSTGSDSSPGHECRWTGQLTALRACSHGPRWSSLSRPRCSPRWSSLSRPRQPLGGRACRDHAATLGGRACRDHATPAPRWSSLSRPRRRLGGRACRDHASPRWSSLSRPRRLVRLVRTGRGRAAAGRKSSRKKFPGPLWRTPFSGPQCRWSVLELGHDREPRRRPRHRRRGAGVRAGARTAAADAAEASKLQAAVAWAAMHSVDSLAEAATVWDHGETGMPVAGPGAPLVGEFSVTEFAAAIGLPTEAGKAYLGEAVELRYRLRPGLVPGGQGRPARLAGPPDRPRDHGPVDGGRRVRGPPRRARRAQGPPRPARPARRGGDRAVHARGGRTPPPPGRRRPVLHHRHPAALAAGHQHRVRGARPRRRPRPRRRRRRRGAGVEGPRLHRHPGRAAGHRGRGPRPPPTHPRPQPHHPGRDRRTETDAGRATRRRPTARPATAPRRSGPAGPRSGRPASRVRWCCTCTSPTPPSSPAPRWTGEFGRVENTRGPVHAEQIRQWCGNPDAQITVQPGAST